MEPNPYGIDEEEFGYSLANLIEILVACLEAAAVESVIEVGAQRGMLTRELLSWGNGRGARIVAVDSDPEPQMLELAAQREELELVRESSPAALRRIGPVDAVILDGDHNHFTVSEELRTVEAWGAEGGLPLVLAHDVCWPHGRRDAYYAPERVPAEHRQPLARDVELRPRVEGIADGGLAYRCVAAREGGPRNGVLTAIEDFVAERPDLRLRVVPAFFGLAVVWDSRRAHSDAIEAVLAPVQASPVLERLETNRVSHLVARVQQTALLRGELERRAELEGLLARLLDSRAFAWAERASRIRQGGEALFSREELRRLLSPRDRPANRRFES